MLHNAGRNVHAKFAVRKVGWGGGVGPVEKGVSEIAVEWIAYTKSSSISLYVLSF